MRDGRRWMAGAAALTMLATLPGAAAPQAGGARTTLPMAGAWGYAPAGPGDQDQALPPGTYRYRARLTQSGSGVVLTFSNAEGDRPITIASAAIGEAAGDEGVAIRAGSLRPVTFAGAAGAELPVGRAVLSDAAAMRAATGRDVIVSVTFATPTRPSRTNLGLPMAFAGGLSRDGGGDAGQFERIQARAYLSLITVQRPAAACTIVAFGDSITDGYLALSPKVRGWPGRLAERLAKLPPAQACGVVNMGVSGNRVLGNGRGVSALDRFWRDVASVPGVTHVVLLEGINDIGSGGNGNNPVVTPDMLIAGYRQFVARAHALGIKVVGATITPALGAGYMSDDKERTRSAVNAFIRTGGLFDAVVDFDAAVRDPAQPARIRAAFDPGDHLHPNDAGLAAMGDAVPLSIFAPGRR